MSFIYKITNDTNNKVYIGLTSYDNPIDRWTKHLKEYQFASKYTKRPLYEAMQKYGVEHFHFEVIEETDKPQEREQYWIEYYHSYIGDPNCNGYNATLGGDGLKRNFFSQEEIQQIIALYKEGYSCRVIASLTGHSITTISNKLKSLNYEIKNFKGNAIAQYDKQNNLIATYPSANVAAQIFGVKKDTHINEVCNGKRKTAYGYIWKWI